MKNRWLFGIFLIGFIWLIISQFTEIEDFIATLENGKWEWLILAAFLQVVFYWIYTASFQSAFSCVGVKSQIRGLIPVLLGSIFVSSLTPTFNTGGQVLFIDDAIRRGESGMRTAAGTVLQMVADFSAFSIFVMMGLGYLFLQNNLETYMVIAAVLFVIVTIACWMLFAFGLRNISKVEKLLGFLQALINRVVGWFKKGPLLVGNWAERNALEYHQAALALVGHPVRLGWTLLLTFISHIVDVLSLFAVFLAFNNKITLGPLIAGYTIGILIWIVSITPQGIGIVEGAMSLVFISLGIQAEVATAASLAYRGFTFWLPLVVGFFLLRKMRLFTGNDLPLKQ